MTKATTPELAAIIGASLLILLVVRAVSWRVVRAATKGAPLLVPRLAGLGFWQRSAPFRTRASARFPRLSKAVAARFSLTRFSGLPQTLIVVAGLYVLAMFGGLIDDVRENEGLVRLDQSIDGFFAPYRADWLLSAFLWITAIGAGPSLTAVLLCATALLASDGRARLIPPLWIAFLGAQATTWSSKYIIARPRPAFLPDITEWNPSFPSGHATASTALIGMLGTIVALHVTTLRARFEVAFWTTVAVALICFSRLFLGVHFLTDVAAGILVGLFWLLVGATVAALWSPRTIGKT